MKFEIRPGEPVEEEVKRIALGVIENTIETLSSSTVSHEDIHEARKSFKRLRALVRLVRFETGKKNFKSENRCFRDAGRKLSDIRDITTLMETAEKVKSEAGNLIKEDVFPEILSDLENKREKMSKKITETESVYPEVVKSLEKSAERINDWKFKNNSFEAIRPGLEKMYEDGFVAIEIAGQTRENGDLHEWRKRVKDFLYQAELLKNCWMPVMETFIGELHRLSDYLGDDHDLAIFEEHLKGDGHPSTGQKTLGKLLTVTVSMRKGLQKNAFLLGEKIYCEPPRRFVNKMGKWWEISRKE